MITYQLSVTQGFPLPCTEDIWNEIIDRPAVKNICDQIAALDPEAPDFNDRKQTLKRRLPIIIPHARAFVNNKRVSADAIPSGLAMLDVDHVDNPRDWWNNIISSFSAKSASPLSDELVASSLRRHGSVLVAITASGHGIRIIGERLERESIEAAQLRMATALNITEYDAVTKDLARASYVVPRDYILWIYAAGLFSEEDRPDLRELPALPPHVEDSSSVSPESDSDTGTAGLSYRGIPYADIVQQLMLSIGAADGAEQGERNTVYFTLANYMRYICDFNVDLLLQVLPTFGLSEPTTCMQGWMMLSKNIMFLIFLGMKV